MKNLDKKEERKSTITTYFRITVIACSVLFQVVLTAWLTWVLSEGGLVFFVLSEILGLFVIFFFVKKHGSSSFRVAWIVIILVAPFMGCILFWSWGRINFNKKEKGSLDRAFSEGFKELSSDLDKRYLLKDKNVRALEKCGYPLYENTKAKYFSEGALFFDSLIEDLKKAKKYIFLSFFIIDEDSLWEEIYIILKEKIRQGVEVRLMYDDVGCFFKISDSFQFKLIKEGINVVVFNPATRYLSDFYLNYRNHQKTVVIDGEVGYTGGVNIADEYINRIERFGYWKDCGIRIEGEAAKSLLVNFLQMWNLSTHTEECEYKKYISEKESISDGHFQPYADGPGNNDNTALDVIRNAIAGAKERIWFTTPYLVIDPELTADICLASKSGVEVVIVTPYIQDKSYVKYVNRNQYKHLIKNGVKIYEYSPGFIHSKLVLADTNFATVGSINLDFRSLYFHYENGIAIYNSSVINDIENDIEEIIRVSKRVTLETIKAYPIYKRALGSVLNVFSPLM